MARSTIRTALVTGSSRGLGRAAAIRLARDGFRVAIHYSTKPDAADAVAAEIRSAGGEAQVFGADLSTPAGFRSLFDQLDAAWGANGPYLDVLVNNAGVNQAVPFPETTEEQFDRLFNINVKGPFFGTQAALSRLRDGGRVIFLGTGLTRFALPQYAAYAASKGAIDVLAKYLAKQLGSRGITVNVIAPGATETDMNPYLQNPQAQQQVAGVTALGRHGKPDDIADVVSFLASDDSRWVTGQRIEASGGAML